MNEKTALLLQYEGFENVFITNPPSDRDFILISNSGGYGEEEGNTGLTRPTIQIMVANKDYKTAKTIIKDIKKYLMSLSYEDINHTLCRIANDNWDKISSWDDWDVWDRFTEYDELVGYVLQSDNLELGVDSQLRHRISINYMLFQNII